MSAKKLIMCFPGKNPVNSREKSGDITFFFLDAHFSRFSLEPLGSYDFFLAIEILYQAEPNSELMYTKKMTLQEQSFSFFNGLKLNSLD